MDEYIYMKQRKNMQDSEAVLFDICKYFLYPDHVARQASDAERKLRTLAIMARRSYGTGTSMSHSIRNSTESLNAFWIMATVKWMKTHTFSMELWSILLERNIWYTFQCIHVLSSSNGHKEMQHDTICPCCKDQKSANKA